MSITRSDFDSSKAGDKLIDALGDEWSVVNIHDNSSKTIRAHFMGSITVIRFINGALVDSNSHKIEILCHPKAMFVPSK